MQSGFQIDIAAEGDRHTLCVSGELDLSSAPELTAAIADCAQSARVVVLDLRALRFIDSSGIQAILSGQRHCSDSGCEYLVDRAMPAQVERVFVVAGLDGPLPLSWNSRANGHASAAADPPGSSGQRA